MTNGNASLVSEMTTVNAHIFSHITKQPGEHVDSHPISMQILLGLMASLIGTTNIVGNSLTIIAFVKDVKLRTVHNHYIVNLAITDLLIGVNSIPFYAVYTILYYVWPFGYTFCKIWSVIDFLVCAESVATIILISWDRYLLVSQGAQYSLKQTKRKALFRIMLSWLLSFLLYGPAIIGFNHWRGYSTVEDLDCDTEFASEQYFTMVTACIEFFVPLLLISFFNMQVYMNIRRRSRGIVPEVTTVTDQRTLRRDRKAARSLAVLVIAFIMCWSPYTVCTIIISFCDQCVNESFYDITNWVLWANSSLNPLLYAATNERFRENYMKLLGLYTCFNLQKKPPNIKRHATNTA